MRTCSSRTIFVVMSMAIALCNLRHASAVGRGELVLKLTAPDPQPGAGFGDMVTIVDGDILVGEPTRFHPDTGVGRAYLFDGATGGLKLTLNNPEVMDQDAFAGAVAGGDGRIFASAIGLEERVYAFNAQNGEWLQRIDDPNGPEPGALCCLTGFGAGLAYGSRGLVVSAPTITLDGVRTAGQVYLFGARDNQLIHTFPNPEPAIGAGFGRGLATIGGDLAVGAILADSPIAEDAGRVWLFDSESGEVKFAIDNPNPESRFLDWFGWSVAANADMIVVGAREDGTSGIDGSGTVYTFSSQTGELLYTLFSPQLERNGEFGRSVALTPQGNILVGAWGTSASGIEAAGHVYLFDGQTGNLLLDIPNPEPSEFALFGWSVVAVEGRILVGAVSGGAAGLPGTGAVYVFATVPEPATVNLAVLLLARVLLTRFPTRKNGMAC